MVPDAGELLAGSPPLDHAPWVDIFWFHYYLDTHSGTDGIHGSVLFVGLMVVTIIGVFTLDTMSWLCRRADPRVMGDGSGRDE